MGVLIAMLGGTMQLFRLLWSLSIVTVVTVLGFCFPAQAHRFHRAMAFTGSGFNAAPMFLGMLQAAQDAGQAPDVLVTTCGGSFAAELALQFSDSAQRLAFMTSPATYAMITSVGVNGDWQQIGKLAETMVLTKQKDWIPPIFTSFLLDIPQNMFSQWEKPWNGNPALSVVMVSGQALFFPQDEKAARQGRQLFKEVYFTDQSTAQDLMGFESPVAQQFPAGSVILPTATFVGWPMGEAVRASVSDPFLMHPAQEGQLSFVTGAIDLYPIELAHQLADEVVMPFNSAKFLRTQFSPLGVVFRTNYVQRLARVNDQYADFWIDISDEDAIDQKYAIDPSITPDGVAIQYPDGYAGFVSRVKALWSYGYSRAWEALALTTRNDKTHIRQVDWFDSSAELRRKLGRK